MHNYNNSLVKNQQEYIDLHPCPALLHSILSCILSCPIQSCLLSCPILSCPVCFSCSVLFYPAFLSWSPLLFYILSCPTCHILSCSALFFPVKSAMFCSIVSCSTCATLICSLLLFPGLPVL